MYLVVVSTALSSGSLSVCLRVPGTVLLQTTSGFSGEFYLVLCFFVVLCHPTVHMVYQAVIAIAQDN